MYKNTLLYKDKLIKLLGSYLTYRSRIFFFLIKLYYYIYNIILLLRILLIISSYSWMTIWIAIEINLLSLITLIYSYKTARTSEASIKYFIVQAVASLIFLWSIIIKLINIIFINYIYLIVSILIIKIRVAPLHFWFPEIIEGRTWLCAGILITFQKIRPIIIMSYLSINLNFIIYFSLLSIIIGGVQGLNQTRLRKILAFSSITHSGWIIISTQFSSLTWLIYIFFYTFTLISLLILLNKININKINNFLLYYKNNLILFIFLVNILIISGIPPFIIFFPKWIIMQLLTSGGLLSTPLLIVTSTLITTFIYLQIIFSIILFNPLLTISYWKIKNINIYVSLCLIITFILSIIISFPFF